MKKNLVLLAGVLVLLAACQDPAKSRENGPPDYKGTNPRKITKTYYSPRLQEWLDNCNSGEAVDVIIALEDDSWRIGGITQKTAGEVEIIDGTVISRTLNGSSFSEKEVKVNRKKTQARLTEVFTLRQENRLSRMTRLTNRLGWSTKAHESSINSRNTFITRKMSREGILDLSKHSDLIAGVELAEQEENQIDSALNDMGLSVYALPYSRDGTGIGVYMREANGSAAPDSSANGFNSGNYTLINGTPTGTSSHATRVGICIQQAAPDAHLYASGEYFVPGVPSDYDPPILIANHSWSSGSDSGSYMTRDRDFDNDVYNNFIATFVSAGNYASEVTTPAKAFNVFAIGGYNDVSHTMYSNSCYINPETNAEKPELLAPSVSLTIAGIQGNTGTSFSSPLAAGFAADLMENYSWLYYRPYLLKAMMMSGATLNIEGDSRLSEKDGAGALNFFQTYYSGYAWWWEGENSDFFNDNKEITIDYNLTAGQRYRAVVVWLVPGSYAYTNKNVNMDIDLSVKYEGSTVTGSYSFDNAFEIVDFTAVNTGTHQFRLYRYTNSGEGNIYMGLFVNRIL